MWYCGGRVAVAPYDRPPAGFPGSRTASGLPADVSARPPWLHTLRGSADLLWLDHDDRRFAAKLVSLRSLVDMHGLWQESELFERVLSGLDATAGGMLAAQVRAWFHDASLVASAA